MSRILDLLHEELELEGYEPGTETFERLLVARKVKKCQALQQVGECQACKAYLDCALVRQHMLNLRFGGTNGSG